MIKFLKLDYLFLLLLSATFFFVITNAKAVLPSELCSLNPKGEHCSFMDKLKYKVNNINNLLDYFEKRKMCIKRKDNADTVAIGKRIYKNCMENN